MMPGQPMPVRTLAPQSQAYVPQPAQWQTPAHLMPAKVRGVSAEAPRAFALPSPETLGVSANLNLAQPAVTKTQVDWNQIQARMERLNVLKYEKDLPQAGVIRVKMLLPTSDPTRAQPVEAQAETEAVAIVMALDAAEAWQNKK